MSSTDCDGKNRIGWNDRSWNDVEGSPEIVGHVVMAVEDIIDKWVEEEAEKEEKEEGKEHKFTFEIEDDGWW